MELRKLIGLLWSLDQEFEVEIEHWDDEYCDDVTDSIEGVRIEDGKVIISYRIPPTPEEIKEREEQAERNRLYMEDARRRQQEEADRIQREWGHLLP